MVLTPHMLVGAAIGSKVGNVWVVFVLAIIAHFLIDKLPHWDYSDDVEEEIKNAFLLFISKVFLDLLSGSIILWYVFGVGQPLAFNIFVGAVAGILPDMISFLILIEA